MYSLALALSMVALEEAAASTADRRRAAQPDPAPLDAAGLAAYGANWRSWAADGRETRTSRRALGASDDGGARRQPLPTGAGG